MVLLLLDGYYLFGNDGLAVFVLFLEVDFFAALFAEVCFACIVLIDFYDVFTAFVTAQVFGISFGIVHRVDGKDTVAEGCIDSAL